MRLENKIKQHLKTSIAKLRPNAEIYLFGSRIDDEKFGGDIDIIIICDPVLSIKENTKLKIDFWNTFGEQ